MENGTNLNLVPTFLFDFYTDYIYIQAYPALLGHNTQRADRQTDRQTEKAIGIGRLCYSIGGLKIAITISHLTEV